MSQYYILDDNNEPLQCDAFEFARWFEGEDGGLHRQVAKTDFPEARISVSTVFVGLNHNFDLTSPPHIFETMVFRNDSGEELWRCSTWGAAERQHVEACDIIHRELGQATSGTVTRGPAIPLKLTGRKIRIRKNGPERR